MTRSMVKSVDYEARRGDDGEVEIVVTIEHLVFREQVIPDGQLAGSIGHIAEPSTAEYVFSMGRGQALLLVEQIQRALSSWA